ncbi:alpha/beta fold hydrolase [Allobranchiibius sp. GilTou38]|uniref:esterase/lipase family protein n=1 Tax=Allobranchiibius sp. GilTou38 TaxID=2815210 RepID=UPI001AA0F627|nr:alpha/beta fold hydrolase [Allobranchiibius sp. GilTou38]MBO1768317.1 lipase [Allobranchiibius sp. GilTou38]
MTRRRIGQACTGVALVGGFCVAQTTPAQAAALDYPVGGSVSGYASWVSTPDANPPGVNVPCTPSAAHPRPVVLLEGTTSRITHSFARIGPLLADQGYCVYGLNYGDTQLTASTGGVIGAMGDIPTSARQVSGFVDKVLAQTGAAKVDIVGWSQGGGPLPRYYLQNLGGASKVDSLVGLAPSNYGTSFFGVLSLIGAVQNATGVDFLSASGAPAFDQQLNTSPFTKALNAHGDTVPGVHYTVIETRLDDVVTPYTNAFLKGPGATNIVLQQQCPLDGTDHLGIIYDNNAIQDVLNALGPRVPKFKPSCQAALPLVGTPGLGGLPR